MESQALLKFLPQLAGIEHILQLWTYRLTTMAFNMKAVRQLSICSKQLI